MAYKTTCYLLYHDPGGWCAQPNPYEQEKPLRVFRNDKRIVSVKYYITINLCHESSQAALISFVAYRSLATMVDGAETLQSVYRPWIMMV